MSDREPSCLGAGTAGEADVCPAWPVPPCPGHALANDGAVHLRVPVDSDISCVIAMWARCSLATRVSRFHAPVRHIPASHLEAVLSDPSASLVAVPWRSAAVAAPGPPGLGTRRWHTGRAHPVAHREARSEALANPRAGSPPGTSPANPIATYLLRDSFLVSVVIAALSIPRPFLAARNRCAGD
jgi:hypothetical protein